MSFSVTFIGKSEAIKRSLEKTSSGMSGQSKAEFDAVRPSLETIIDQNVGDYVVRLEASGHASFDADGKKTYGTCSASISNLGRLVE